MDVYVICRRRNGKELFVKLVKELMSKMPDKEEFSFVPTGFGFTYTKTFEKTMKELGEKFIKGASDMKTNPFESNDCAGFKAVGITVNDNVNRSDIYKKKIAEMRRAMEVDHVIFNPPATIVFWRNGEKTIVKCQEDQEFNPYFGFCAAVTKHIIGNNTVINRIVDDAVDKIKVKVKDNKTAQKYVRYESCRHKDVLENRLCANCKYMITSGEDYPCVNCCHLNGKSDYSYWVKRVEEDKK